MNSVKIFHYNNVCQEKLLKEQLPKQKTVRKAGRPGASSRKAILQAAQELLLEGGEKALSYRKLATKLGITAPTIYSYFGDKQQLIAAISDHVLDIRGIVVNSHDSPRDQLQQLLSALRDQLLVNAHLLPLFHKALPAEQMVAVVEVLSQPIVQAGIERGKAVRHAQSLVWMLLSFTLFEVTAKDALIAQQFIQVDEKYNDTLAHLDIENHERLWQETLQRNLDGLFV